MNEIHDALWSGFAGIVITILICHAANVLVKELINYGLL